MRFPGRLALVLLAATTAAGGWTDVRAREAGVAAAVNADSLTLPPAQPEQTLVVGHNLVFDERVTTGAEGQAQLLMLDQSAVTVGPNSSLVIDKFVYDPDTRTGEMALSLSRGLMRFVGGRLSKNGNATVRTPVATMGIRGGIALVNVINETTVDVTLLYGDAVEGTTDAGESFSVRRNGYFTRLETGKQATPPAPAGAQTVAATISQLQGRSTATAGALEAPSEEAAVQEIGAAPPPPVETPPPIQDIVDEVVEGGGEEADRTPISNPDEEELLELANLIEFAELEAFGLSFVKQGKGRLETDSRLIRLISLGGEEVSGAQADAKFFLVNGDGNRFLLAEAGKGGLLFRPDGVGDPNAVPNIFGVGGADTFVSPQRFNVDTGAAIGQADAAIFAAQNVQGGKYFNYDLTTANFNGVVGTRQTIFGGAPITQAPGGRSFFEPNQDSQTLSLLPESDVGRYRLPNGAGFAGTRQIDPANVKQTPIMIDWNTGKALYLGGVFQNLNGGAAGSGESVAAVQVFVGEATGGEGQPIAFIGRNAGGTHFERGAAETRSYHTGFSVATPLGDANDMATSLDGGHLTIRQTAQNSVENHQFGQEAAFAAVGDPGEGVDVEQLFAGGVIANDEGELEVLATNPNGVEGVGTLRIDRDNMEVSMRFVVDSGPNDPEPFVLTSNPNNSAFFDDNHFGLVQNSGFQNGGNASGFLVSGEAVLPGEVCKCEFMHWGLWAGGEIDPGALNTIADIGGFFAGAPTPDIDMPASGQATFNGNAFASMQQPGGQTPFFATGAFQLNVNFANGISVGDMNLGRQNFAILGQHTPGAAALAVQYFQNTLTVGSGNGAFFGPGAENVGVTIDIDGNGVKAGGVAVAER